MGINLNGTGGGIVLNGARDPGLEKAINEEIAARKAADEALDEKKTDKPTLSSDTESINIDTNSGNKVTVLTDKGVSTLVSGKADKSNHFGGFEGGSSASTQSGGAVGNYAISSIGGAVGSAAKTAMGGSIGANTMSGNGFSGGFGAKTIKDNTVVDAVQLGTGTNPNPKTIQVYDKQLMDADGHIPNDRMPTKSDKTTYNSATTTDGAITYDLLNKNNSMTTYVSDANAASSVAITVSEGVYDNGFIAGLSFWTGDTPPEVSYTSNIYILQLVGAECVTTNAMSVFSPIANKVYDILFYFNGSYIVGLVTRYDHVS